MNLHKLIDLYELDVYIEYQKNKKQLLKRSCSHSKNRCKAIEVCLQILRASHLYGCKCLQ